MFVCMHASLLGDSDINRGAVLTHQAQATQRPLGFTQMTHPLIPIWIYNENIFTDKTFSFLLSPRNQEI